MNFHVPKAIRHTLLLGLFLLPGLSLFGQVAIQTFDFNLVSGVDSITQVLQSDYHTSKDVYFYNDGRRVRINSIVNDTLVHYQSIQYNDNRQIVTQSSYGRMFAFDDKKNALVSTWDTTYFDLTVNSYSDGVLSKKTYGNVHKKDTSTHKIFTYEYDDAQRLTSETHRDVFTGFQGYFESNSAEILDILEEMDEEVYQKIYTYTDKKVEITHLLNEVQTGKALIDLNESGLVIRIRHFNLNNDLLFEVTAKYDNEGRVTSTEWKTYDSMTVWGFDGDVVNDGTEEFTYSSSGWLIESKVTYQDGQITMVYTYY